MAAVATRPAALRRIPVVHVPPAPLLAYKRPSPQPSEPPNPSLLGDLSPVHNACSLEEEEKGRRREDPEAVHEYTGAAAKTRRPPVELQDVEKLRTATGRHPLLPLLHAAVFFLADDPAPPLYTNACTLASGHRGEDALSRPSVDVPAFEPRVNVVSAVAAAAAYTAM
jgi:hypothetical protein